MQMNVFCQGRLDKISTNHKVKPLQIVK